MPTPILALVPLVLAPAADLEWCTGPLETALERAGSEGRTVFAYFWADGSQQCARTWSDAITSAGGQAELAKRVCYSARIGDAETTALVQRYGVRTLPTMLVLLPDGRPEDALVGYHPESFFVSELQRIERGVDTVGDRRRKAEAAPDDLQLRFELAAKLDHVGALDESLALYESIKRDDPRGETPVAARLHLWDVMQAILDAAPDPDDPSGYDLEPMYEHLPRVRVASVLFEGWEWAIGVERARGDRAAARRGAREAWPELAPPERLPWGLRTAWTFWQERDELTAGERRFALEVARECALEAERLAAERAAAGAAAEELDLEPLDVLGSAYLLNGRREEALAALEKSVAANGSTPQREQLLERCRGEGDGS